MGSFFLVVTIGVKMSVLCGECKDKVYAPGAGITRAILSRVAIKESQGYMVCHSHVDRIRDKVHQLDDLSDGIILVIDERTGYVHQSGLAAPIGTHSHLEPTPRTRIFGYLSLPEARQYFPNTCRLILGSLGN